MAALTILKRVAQEIVSEAITIAVRLFIVAWDLLLTFINHALPQRPVGRVVPKGHPGYNGRWPQYVAPGEGDSRSSCPGLNAMANHGILPRDGRNIRFTELNAAIREVYNFAPTFCFLVPKHAADMLARNYWTDRFDLADLDAHNCIEHDASVVRHDTYHEHDQSKISQQLVDELLKSATGPRGALTYADLSRVMGKRRVAAKKTNPKYSFTLFQKLFASWNCSTLIKILGGDPQDLGVILREERLPDGWEPSFRRPMGLTFLEHVATVVPLEFGIKEEVDGSLAAARVDP
ncbi:chloroperoxidase-like protein [Trametes elegans]|nr:chloroperoxidase-like protein [Trametes elegans]